MDGVNKTLLLAILESDADNNNDVRNLITVTGGNDWESYAVPVKDFGINLERRPVGLVPAKPANIIPKISAASKDMFDIVKHHHQCTRAANEVKLTSNADKVLFKMWTNYFNKTIESYALLVLDRQLTVSTYYDDIFLCRYGLFLSDEWQCFETFFNEVKELPNYKSFESEQNLTEDEIDLTKLDKLDNYALTTKYYESYEVGKDTCLFLGLAEIRVYAEAERNGIISLKLEDDNIFIFDSESNIEVEISELLGDVGLSFETAICDVHLDNGCVLRYLPTFGKTTEELFSGYAGDSE